MPLTLPAAANALAAYEDFYETTITAPFETTDTDVYPVTLPVSPAGFLVLGVDTDHPEVIYYNEVGPGYLRVPSLANGEGRGVFQTDPQDWDEGTKIGMYSVAAFFEMMATGRGLRDGIIQARHFAVSLDPNSWIGLGAGLTYAGTDESGVSRFTALTDLTGTLSEGMKLRLERATDIGYNATHLNSTNGQYASKAAPTNVDFTDDYSCEAWIRLDSYPADEQCIVSRTDGTNGWIFSVMADGLLRLVSIGAKDVRSVHTVPKGKWVHVAATMDASGSLATMYIDGVAVEMYVTGGGSAHVPAGALTVGSYIDGVASNFFNGSISDVRVWATIRNQAQILQFKNTRLVPGDQPALVAYYPLSTNFDDSTSNNNDLNVIGGSAVAANVPGPFSAIEYGFINKINWNGTSTTVYVYTGAAAAPNEALEGISYSSLGAPYGFPLNPQHWRRVVCIRSQYNLVYGPTNTLNQTKLKLGVPPGSWRIGYELGDIEQANTSAANVDQDVTMSSSPTNADFAGEDLDLKTRLAMYNGSIFNLVYSASRSKYVRLDANTPYYLFVLFRTGGGTTTFIINGNVSEGIMYADPAYL
jgi:hypothetical protein